MGVEHLQVSRKKNFTLLPVFPLFLDQREHRKGKTQVLHPSEVEGNLNGQ
jgi:hypothetical protein